MAATPTSLNFAFLRVHDTRLVQLGALAEKYFPEDPSTALFSMRQFVDRRIEFYFGSITRAPLELCADCAAYFASLLKTHEDDSNAPSTVKRRLTH